VLSCRALPNRIPHLFEGDRLFPGKMAEQTLQILDLLSLLSPYFDPASIIKAEEQALADFEAEPVPNWFWDGDLSLRGQCTCRHRLDSSLPA
jgi:hypothetical protein